MAPNMPSPAVSAALLWAMTVTTTAAHIKVSCVGDSITADGSNKRNASADVSYSAQLQAILGSGYAVTNQGVSGQ